jgi:cytochrome P450
MGFARAEGATAIRSKDRLPPGPRRLSDSWALLRSPGAWLDFLARWSREYGDIVFFRFLGVPVCLINDPSSIEQVLVTDHQNFTKSLDYRVLARILGKGLLTSEGDLWRRQRRLIQPAFHRERIQSYAGTMTSCAQRLLENWTGGEIRDIHADMMRVTLEIAARCLFSADIANDASTVGAALAVVMEDILTLANFSFMPQWMPLPGSGGFRRALRELDRIVYGLIRERRANGQHSGDLLDLLLEARDAGGAGMPDRQVRDEVLTLLLAGHETTANTLTWTLYLLAQNPEAQARLEAEVDNMLQGRAPEAAGLHRLPYLETVLMESQRLYPPAWTVGRRAIKAFDILSYRLPAGTNIMVSQWILHRDSRYYREPERFDPDRWAENAGCHNAPKFTYLPFGAGPRVCIGAGLALTEAALILAMLAQRFRFSLGSPEPVELLPSVTLRPKNGLRLRIEKRR